MARKAGEAMLVETWGQAAGNTAGHQGNYLIEAIRKRAASGADRSAEPKKSHGPRAKTAHAAAD